MSTNFTANGRSASTGSTRVTEEDIRAGYVDVVAAPNDIVDSCASLLDDPLRRGTPPVTVRMMDIPQAHPEERNGEESLRRRVTPTTRRRSQQQAPQLTYEELIRRPRSNPRERTPMRYESPMDEHAFPPEVVRELGSAAAPLVNEARRITIRPMAGASVGTTAPTTRTPFDQSQRRPQPITFGKSLKQGPSHRKTRRWNNDNFSNLAAELSQSSSTGGRLAAEILSQAKADARHFLPLYDPNEHKRASYVTRFMQDAQYKAVRDKFFEGELHAHHPPAPCDQRKKASSTKDYSPDALFMRIEGRLRAVVVKACENSAPACKIVESFEDFLLSAFDPTTSDDKHEIPTYWDDVLLEKPSIVKEEAAPTTGASRTSVNFMFDGASSSGGFHRLLVHAVCLFHGLKTSSSSFDTAKGQKVRALSVTGDLLGGDYKLLDHLALLQQQKERQHLSATSSTTRPLVADLTYRIASLEVSSK